MVIIFTYLIGLYVQAHRNLGQLFFFWPREVT